MTRITVLGGTGYAGGALVAEAHRRGNTVTSVSRSTPTEKLDGVEYVTGSALDPSILDTVLAQADVVLVAVSPRGDMAGKTEGLIEDVIARVDGTPIRLGVVGGASSLLVAPEGPRLFDTHEIPAEVKPEVETGMRILDILKASPASVDWFYVSPAQEFGSWVAAPDTGSYRLGGDVLLRDHDGKSVISAADFARAFLDEVETPAHHRKRFHAAH